MRSVWKFTLELSDGAQQLSMPTGASVVHFAMQGDTPCFWAHVHPSAPKETRFFAVHGTGHPIADDRVHRGTCQHGQYVWHLFESV